jgi:hypothetical protein
MKNHINKNYREEKSYRLKLSRRKILSVEIIDKKNLIDKNYRYEKSYR